MSFTVSSNSPSAGHIAWADAHIVYDGVDYPIANGSTNNRFVYWLKASPGSFQVSNAHPALTPDDAIVFLNKGGVPISVLTATAMEGDLVVPGTITTGAIAADAIVAEHISSDAIIARHIVAGAITAEKLSVTNLAAITADMGAVTAGNITLNSTGFIKGGATNYGAGKGFWMGQHSGEYKWRVGTPGGSGAEWDGTNFKIYGPDGSVTLQSGGSAGGGYSDWSGLVAGLGQLDTSNISTVIANGAIGSAQIGSIALVGTANFSVKTAVTGARMEMDSRAIKVFDSGGVKRVQLGDLTA